MIPEFQPPHFTAMEMLSVMPIGVPVAGPRLSSDVAILAGRNPLALNEEDLLPAAQKLADVGIIRFEFRDGRFPDKPQFFKEATCIDRPHFVFTRLS